MNVTLVVGNPKPRSRTYDLAVAVSGRICTGSSATVTSIDLADVAPRLVGGGDDDLTRIENDVRASDLLIVATPTYKSTYSGLLKLFLDRFSSDDLTGVFALPVMTGGSQAHALAPTVSLAPVLAELGAVVVGRGLYFDMGHIDRMHAFIDEWVVANARTLRLAIPALITEPAEAVAR